MTDKLIIICILFFLVFAVWKSIEGVIDFINGIRSSKIYTKTKNSIYQQIRTFHTEHPDNIKNIGKINRLEVYELSRGDLNTEEWEKLYYNLWLDCITFIWYPEQNWSLYYKDDNTIRLEF